MGGLVNRGGQLLVKTQNEQDIVAGYICPRTIQTKKRNLCYFLPKCTLLQTFRALIYMIDDRFVKMFGTKLEDIVFCSETAFLH